MSLEKHGASPSAGPPLSSQCPPKDGLHPLATTWSPRAGEADAELLPNNNKRAIALAAVAIPLVKHFPALGHTGFSQQPGEAAGPGSGPTA